MTDPALRGRARFVDHKGKRMFLIDASHLDFEQILALADLAGPEIRSQPPASVMTITHVEGATLDRRLVDKLRTFVEANRPHVKAACVTGLGPLHRMIFTAVKVLTGREFHVFATVEQAKDFLATVK
ncbi:MAG: hypothetical protein QM704_05335 [Anaeromyxobacteraceae bacterium]